MMQRGLCNYKRMILKVFPKLSQSVIVQGSWFPWQAVHLNCRSPVWSLLMEQMFLWGWKRSTWDIQTQWSLNTMPPPQCPTFGNSAGLEVSSDALLRMGCAQEGWAGAGGWSMPIPPSLLPEGCQGASGSWLQNWNAPALGICHAKGL